MQIYKRVFCNFVFLNFLKMEEPNSFNSDNNEQIQRKTSDKFLRILCILTFIWSGFGILTNLLITLFFDSYNQLLPQINFPAEYKEMKQLIVLMLSAGRFYFLIALLLNISSFFGAFLMFNQKKQGFHFYAIAQIILLMLPMIFIKGIPVSFMEMLTTVSFIGLYAIQTREIRKS